MLSSILLGSECDYLPKDVACAIGVNRALFIQKVHYWSTKGKHIKEGKSWVYNTYDAWQEQFPYLSVRTIRRIAEDLSSLGILHIKRFNRFAFDKTNWFSVDYDRLSAVVSDYFAGKKAKKQKEVKVDPEYIQCTLNFGKSVGTMEESKLDPLPIETITEKTNEEKTVAAFPSISQKESEEAELTRPVGFIERKPVTSEASSAKRAPKSNVVAFPAVDGFINKDTENSPLLTIWTHRRGRIGQSDASSLARPIPVEYTKNYNIIPQRKGGIEGTAVASSHMSEPLSLPASLEGTYPCVYQEYQMAVGHVPSKVEEKRLLLYLSRWDESLVYSAVLRLSERNQAGAPHDKPIQFIGNYLSRLTESEIRSLLGCPAKDTRKDEFHGSFRSKSKHYFSSSCSNFEFDPRIPSRYEDPRVAAQTNPVLARLIQGMEFINY